MSGRQSDATSSSAQAPGAAVTASAEPRLFADAMPGGLARWLRDVAA